MVCLGIWAAGLLIYTILVRVSVPVLAGQVTYARRWHTPAVEPKPRGNCQFKAKHRTTMEEETRLSCSLSLGLVAVWAGPLLGVARGQAFGLPEMSKEDPGLRGLPSTREPSHLPAMGREQALPRERGLL